MSLIVFLIILSFEMKWKRYFVLLCVFLCTLPYVHAADTEKARLLKRVFHYPATVDSTRPKSGDMVGYTYTKFQIHTQRRNFLLMSVPTMYALAHSGNRQYVGEMYDSVKVDLQGIKYAKHLAHRSTIPHNRSTLPTIVNYLTPNVYGNTLVGDNILSPFHSKNRKYYKYTVTSFAHGVTLLTFRPKVKSTQLVEGLAHVETLTGRIVDLQLNGEYDMIKFSLDVEMETEEARSVFPKRCKVDAIFSFMGNKISAQYQSLYGLPPVPPAFASEPDSVVLAKVRPIPLSVEEDSVYRAYDKGRAERSATASARKQMWSKQLWENVGEPLLTSIRSDFGSDRRGRIRINPILNPLYFGYSGRKGFTYKFDVRASYTFSEKQRMAIRLKSGYSFKQRQFYFNMPAMYYFNYPRNGYVEIEVGNGNRITNSLVADAVKRESVDSLNWESMNLEYFKNTHLKLNVHYDFSPYWGLQGGMVFHRRTAVDKKAFIAAGRRYSYTSAAPYVEIEYRPRKYTGPILTASYEHGLKGLFNAGIEYEKFEFDAQYKHSLPCMSALQLRFGTGFYTHQGKDWYFLDYTNFKENTIPGGWNDSWANEFELLNSNWYNASTYYIRANFTYESPIVAVAWMPWLGRFVEKERIYANVLNVKHLHPYLEYGYGISTHVFSAGVFVGQQNGKFEGFGVRFGFELFRQW